MDLLKGYEKLVKAANGIDGRANLEKLRDLTLVDLLCDIKLVVACDSNASNGEKPNDTKSNSYEETAVSALKVPFMEVLATGATPLVVINNLCVEMDPSGKRIINAMKEELKEAGFWENIQFTGSTEDNMVTTQTGIGVTVIGLLDNSKSKLRKTQKDDLVICVGIPQSGIHIPYSEKDGDVCKIKDLVKLRTLDFVHEILPIGSKGAQYEAWEMAKSVDMSFYQVEQNEVDMKTSAGSSTAVLASIKNERVDELVNSLEVPVNVIGRIY